MLIEKIKKDLIESLKSGKKAQVSLIRLLLAAIKDKEIALKKNLDSENAISDEEILEIINKMIKAIINLEYFFQVLINWSFFNSSETSSNISAI